MGGQIKETDPLKYCPGYRRPKLGCLSLSPKAWAGDRGYRLWNKEHCPQAGVSTPVARLQAQSAGYTVTGYTVGMGGMEGGREDRALGSAGKPPETMKWLLSPHHPPFGPV